MRQTLSLQTKFKLDTHFSARLRVSECICLSTEAKDQNAPAWSPRFEVETDPFFFGAEMNEGLFCYLQNVRDELLSHTTPRPSTKQIQLVLITSVPGAKIQTNQQTHKQTISTNLINTA